MALLEVTNLTKRFGGLTACDNISFKLEEGEMVGLIGPNPNRDGGDNRCAQKYT